MQIVLSCSQQFCECMDVIVNVVQHCQGCTLSMCSILIETIHLKSVQCKK